MIYDMSIDLLGGDTELLLNPEDENSPSINFRIAFDVAEEREDYGIDITGGSVWLTTITGDDLPAIQMPADLLTMLLDRYWPKPAYYGQPRGYEQSCRNEVDRVYGYGA